jgi:uncharacterized protein (TIGR01370 family)
MRILSPILLVAGALALLLALGTLEGEFWPFVQDERREGTMPASINEPRRPWDQVNNWVYWLDGPDLEEIGHSAFELAVIDYSADGSAAQEFTRDEIEGLRCNGCQRRILAYLSIGEAEDYRFYWQDTWRPGNPAWIIAENADWQGNYLVAFWDPEWQQLVFRYLDRIIEQDFDGVYLDRVDAYTDEHASGHEQDMVDFVLALAQHARGRSPLGDGMTLASSSRTQRNWPRTTQTTWPRSPALVARNPTSRRATSLPPHRSGPRRRRC